MGGGGGFLLRPGAAQRGRRGCEWTGGTPAFGRWPTRHSLCSAQRHGAGGGTRDALEGKVPRRQSQKRLGRRLEEVAKAVGGRLLSVTNAIEAGTCRQGDSGWAWAGRPGGGGGVPPPPSNASLGGTVAPALALGFEWDAVDLEDFFLELEEEAAPCGKRDIEDRRRGPWRALRCNSGPQHPRFVGGGGPDALCFLVMEPSRLQRLAVGGRWRLAAVGGGWQRRWSPM